MERNGPASYPAELQLADKVLIRIKGAEIIHGPLYKNEVE